MEYLARTIEQALAAGSLAAYLAVFAGGVLAGFSPCVYPLLPVTVGYIGSRDADGRLRRLALGVAYVAGLGATYAALGSAAALTGRAFGAATAGPLASLVVGNLCLLLALSLLDVVRIPLPSPGSGKAGGRGGAGGAFAVGVVSALAVGPCTAPVLGALLLYVASRRNVAFGASLLFVFALGMALLPVLAGTFAAVLARLPRSGAWTARVRQAFALVLFAGAEYFFLQAGSRLG